MKRRVKITGLGFVTPAGIGKNEFLEKIQEPISRVAELEKLSTYGENFIGAEVPEFDGERYIRRASVKRIPRHTQFALACARMAIEDCGLQIEDLVGRNPLIIVGAALMDFGCINKGIELILKKGPLSASPTTVADILVSNISASIGEMIGGKTRAASFQSACCSGLDAIGRAAEIIAKGEAEIAICGGTEAPLYLHPMLELQAAGLSPANAQQPRRQSRPFDRWRTTGVIGEGACLMVLEPESSPRRGYAYVEGHGFASDLRGEPCSGLLSAIRIALGNARTRPNCVEVISAWGPGHRIIDAAEAQVLKEIFGHNLEKIPAYSIKGAIGNPFGAAGAIQAGCAALGIFHGFLPPTVNWEYKDPSCQLQLSAKARYIAHATALINAHGLSGTNSCLVLSS